MKTLLLFSLALLLNVHYVFAQSFTLYGTTYVGGKNGNGTVFSYDPSSGKESVLIDFDSANGNGPIGSLMLDKAGSLLYGTTNSGGFNNDGVLFRYNLNTGLDSALLMFNEPEGKGPGAGELTLYNGNFYGMTSSGGKYGGGTIYMYNISTGKDTTLFNFDTTAGKENNPLGSNLVLCPANGLLYGMTFSGGANDMGAIFSFNPTTGRERIEKSLNGKNGADPQEGTLTLDPANGLFYGVTSAGGIYNYGVLFSFNPLTGEDKTLINFKGGNGANPYGGLILDTLNGFIYGMTNAGGLYEYGVLYSFNTSSNTENVLYSFNDTLGSSPTGNLTLCPDGKLYGTTEEDETGNGVLFSFDPLGNKYQVEFTFNYTNGSSPFGSLAFATKPEVAAVNEVAQAEKISVYPNPTSTYVNIDFKGGWGAFHRVDQCCRTKNSPSAIDREDLSIILR